MSCGLVLGPEFLGLSISSFETADNQIQGSFWESLCPGWPGEGTRSLLLAALSPGKSLLCCQLSLLSCPGIVS